MSQEIRDPHAGNEALPASPDVQQAPVPAPQGEGVEPAAEPLAQGDDEPVRVPRLGAFPRPRGKRLVRSQDPATPGGSSPTSARVSPQQRLLILDTWQRSGLPAAEFAQLVGVTPHCLRDWKRKFDEHGLAGLMDRVRGMLRGSKLPEATKRAILMLKESHPEYGCQRISDELVRGPALPASATAVARVLHEAGYEVEEVPSRPHGQPAVQHFERAKPNELWQTDLFTFNLKRQNRRLYLVAFLDDHSRFLVGYGLHASASTALVIEVLRSAIGNFGPPQEVLTDNGPQYITWRGKSAFAKELEKQGIHHIVATPRRPQTLGKTERFWGTLWKECLQQAVFFDLDDARKRIGLFIDHYNFQRPHQGIEGLVPADRFFGAATEVRKTLEARVAANALELARQGAPRNPLYLTGRVGDKNVSIHQEGQRLYFRDAEGNRQELVGPEDLQVVPAQDLPEPVAAQVILPHELAQPQPSPAPGTSPLDEPLGLVGQEIHSPNQETDHEQPNTTDEP